MQLKSSIPLSHQVTPINIQTFHMNYVRLLFFNHYTSHVNLFTHQSLVRVTH